MAEATCAVWYWRYHGLDYQLFNDEVAAAGYAVYLEDYEEGYVEGVQFADGRTIKVGEWSAFKAEEQRRERERQERVAAAKLQPPRPTRKIANPFSDSNGVVEVEIDEPAWLGRSV